MYDIVGPAAETAARELGITPLILGEDVAIITDRAGLKSAAATIVLSASSDRTLLEGPIDGVVAVESEARKDHLHHRKSGLDQISARILADGKKALVLSLAAVREADDPALILGRMRQNALIAKKKSAPIILASLAQTAEEVPTTHDLEAFFRAHDIPEDVVVKSQEHFAAWLERARTRASDRYVAEGVTKSL